MTGRSPRLLLSAAALVLAVSLGWPSGARASFDEFADSYSPKHFALRAGDMTLTLKGELELELHDLEGEGGPGYDSPTDTRTIGTRSPFVEIDSFWLALRLGLGEQLGVFSVLEFGTSDARVGAVWFDFRAEGPSWLEHHVELGYHTPIVKTDRRTERYPLIGSAYWRQPELHLAYEAIFHLAENVELEIGASVAMMRPLEFMGVQESTSQAGTINLLVSGPARTFSGNGPVGGGRVRLSAWGAFLDGFGFVGKLAAEAGTDSLRSGFPNYRDLPGYSTEDAREGDFWWAGGRVGWQGWGATVFAEAIASREDLLKRWGVYVQGSYRAVLSDAWDWLRSVEPLVRWETLRIRDAAQVHDAGRALRSTAVINAVSWDWEVLTLALTAELYRDVLRLRVEYYFIWEQNGVSGLGIPNEPFRNDELLVQAEIRF